MNTQNVYNVKDFGAIGNAEAGKRITPENFKIPWMTYPKDFGAVIYHLKKNCEFDSKGIQNAIDTAHNQGGGTVFVPAGNYLITPIQLKSNINLHLDIGANLWASPNLNDYSGDEIESSLTNALGRKDLGLSGKGIRRLFSASNCENFSITGSGQISAQSGNWLIPWLDGDTTKRLKTRPTDTFLFYKCKNIKIENIRILDTPSWTLVFDTCDNVKVTGIQIKTLDIINSDGIDLVNTSNVRISDCDIHCTDDSICLKNMTPDTTMRNIVVTNCILRTLCNGIKIGTDTAGNFEDITFNNIVIANSENDPKGAEGGINICALDGGYVRNINISNIIMRNIECPFYFIGGCRDKQKDYRKPIPGLMERINLNNIMADGTKYTNFIIGLDNSTIKNIFLNKIKIRKTSGFYSEIPGTLRKPNSYPTPYMFGSDKGDDMPAHGLYLQNASNIQLNDFQVDCTSDDIRDCIIENNCHNILR